MGNAFICRRPTMGAASFEDVTARNADVLKGKYFHNSDGNLIQGSMPNNGTIRKTFNGIDTKSVSIPNGYTSGGTVSLTNDIDNIVSNSFAALTEQGVSVPSNANITNLPALIRAVPSGAPNGTAWTASETTATGSYIVAFKDKFIACGGTGIIYSTDGKSWQKSSVTTGTYTEIKVGNGIAIALNQAGNIVYSSDGITWTSKTMPGNIVRIEYGIGKFYAFTTSNNYVSSDGNTWALNGELDDMIDVVFVYDRLIAASFERDLQFPDEKTYRLSYSLDGKSWMKINEDSAWEEDFSDHNIYNINAIYGDGTYILSVSCDFDDIGMYGHNYIMMSVDGELFEELSILPSAYNSILHYSDLAYGAGVFAVGASDGIYVIDHEDERTCTKKVDLALSTLSRVAYANGVFVGYGDGDGLFYSADYGATWSNGVTNSTTLLPDTTDILGDFVNHKGIWVCYYPGSRAMMYSESWEV